ncbi:hypothetical protein ACQ86N_38625 [Puia sp. P3]
MVDKDNNISLSGKNGLKVYIDGRQVPSTAATSPTISRPSSPHRSRP